METLHAVGVGALNKDIKFEIPPENFPAFNKEIKGERIRKIELNTQYSDKPNQN